MLKLKAKQAEVVELVNDRSVDTIFLIGAVGTGKTDVAAHIGLSMCASFPNTYWTVFRKNISTAKRTVIPSYLTMADRMNLIRGKDFDYNGQDFEMKFPNGSIIGFVEADETRDRDGRKIKGINATATHIDEADELSQTMYVNAASRRGRRNEQGQPSITVISMNPNDVEHIEAVYMQWKYPEKYGSLPAGTRVVEFGVEDSWQSPEDIQRLLTNPEWWVERFMRNNWEYQDESKTIFRSSVFQKAIVGQYASGKKTAGYDVARDGVDKSVCADWENLVLIGAEIVKDERTKMDTGTQADWLISHSDLCSIGYENIAVDGVGVGVGVIDGGKDRGANFQVFMSGFSVDKYLTFGEPKSRQEAENSQELMSFNNLRSQLAYMLAMGLDSGKVKILDSFPFLNEFIKEAQQHHHEYKDKVFVLESKETIKKRLGRSPDIFDAVLMGFWLQLKKQPTTEWATAADMF